MYTSKTQTPSQTYNYGPHRLKTVSGTLNMSSGIAGRNAKRFVLTHQNVPRKSHRKHDLGRPTALDSDGGGCAVIAYRRQNWERKIQKSTLTQINNDDNNNKY